MADNPSSSSYGEGIKWTIGLSGAAIAGVFLHLADLGKQPSVVKWVIAAATALFAISIMCGVNYLHWLMAEDTDRVRRKEIDEELPTLAATDPRAPVLQDRRKEHIERIDRSYEVKPRWHVGYLISFLFASVLSTVVLFAAILHARDADEGNKKAECACGKSVAATSSPPPNRFVVTYSALHQGVHGKETHTFLLDQQTGEVWQMRCFAKNQVEFVPVSVIHR